MELSVLQVSLALVPIIAAVVIYGLMVKDWSSVLWATLRMVVQLIAIGYALNYIFNLHHPSWVLMVIVLMSIGAGWIAVRPIRKFKKPIMPIFVAVIVSGWINLIWILVVVLRPNPWFLPSVLIPITGMVMANSMNAVSLCAERFWSELKQKNTIQESTLAALTAAMIPQINALLAVGLVSLPGMMTGQILSGVSPLIAVRYQIVIMAMVLSTAAFGSFIYLFWYRKYEPESK